MRMTFRLLRSLFLLLALVAAGPSGAAGDYGLSTGDLVRVTVYDHPDLATETRVTDSGGILFPLLGEVSVSGATANEAAGRIAKALEKGGFIKNPQVNLVVMDFRGQEISVLGQVNRPGKFPLQKASRVTDILALAGGVTPLAADTLTLISRRDGNMRNTEIDLVTLFRQGGDKVDLQVASGDILYVPRESRFYIYGEVQRPGVFRLERNMTLVQALSVGGGPSARGTQKGIRILRRGDDGSMQTIEASLSDPLQSDDVIYVKESLF